MKIYFHHRLERALFEIREAVSAHRRLLPKSGDRQISFAIVQSSN
jgi:hypothetical protein